MLKVEICSAINVLIQRKGGKGNQYNLFVSRFTADTLTSCYNKFADILIICFDFPILSILEKRILWSIRFSR